MITFIAILLCIIVLLLYRHLRNFVEHSDYTCIKIKQIETELKKLNDKI